MIQFKDVFASYDSATPILQGVNCTIEEGEFVAIVGTNGAGKSTAMRLINGLLKPESGEVLLDGVPVSSYRTSEIASRVGFLFQNPDAQICCNTVREELCFGFKAQGTFDEEASKRVDRIIEEFGFRADDDPFLLNRGSRQLLALASIVVLETDVVVLDEPTTGLDFRECVKVMDIIDKLHASGTTVVMVCHDMEVVADYAERIIVMADGCVIGSGPTFEILRDEQLMQRASLVPPQIVDISLALEHAIEPSCAPHVRNANTIDEMCDAIAACKGVAYLGPRGQEGTEDPASASSSRKGFDNVRDQENTEGGTNE